MAADPTSVTWQSLQDVINRLAEAVTADGTPQVLVGVLRGGAIPATWLAHTIGVRDVRMAEVTRTVSDAVNAAKTAEPVVRHPASLGDLTGLDVLVVDDVAGTGDTIAAAVRLAEQAGATRVRNTVCVVNRANWTGHRPPEEAVTFIGSTTHGWVVFPWEMQP